MARKKRLGISPKKNYIQRYLSNKSATAKSNAAQPQARPAPGPRLAAPGRASVRPKRRRGNVISRKWHRNRKGESPVMPVKSENKRAITQEVKKDETKSIKVIVPPVSPIKAATAIKADGLYSDPEFQLNEYFEFEIDKTEGIY